MGCPNSTRRDAIVVRVIPARGQVPEYASKHVSSIRAKQPCHVLHKHEAGSHLANDPPEVGPKIALVGPSSALAGDAVWLTWRAAKDEIHASTPGSPVESTQVIPDGRGLQPPVSHPLLNESLAVFVSLDVADSSTEADGFECCASNAASGT